MEANESSGSGFEDPDYDNEDSIGSFYTAVLPIITIVALGVIIFLGAILNITAIIALMIGRLWRQHEGYLYILAIFVGNCAIISFKMFPHFFWLLPSHVQLEATSDFACKMWHFIQNVANSTGWIVIATLLDAYLHDLLERGVGCYCLKRFARKFCTSVGSVITIVIISICFALMNCWTLWATKIILLNGLKNPDGYIYICDIADKWFHIYYEWEIQSMWIKLFIPVGVFVPIFWALTLWSRRKHDAGFSVFVYARVDPIANGRDFVRASLVIGAAVFLLQFPRIVTGIMNFDFHNLNFYVAHRFAHLLFKTHVVVVPLCCLITVPQMRNDLMSLIRRSCRKVGGGTAAQRFLPLNSVQAGSTSIQPSDQ